MSFGFFWKCLQSLRNRLRLPFYPLVLVLAMVLVACDGVATSGAPTALPPTSTFLPTGTSLPTPTLPPTFVPPGTATTQPTLAPTNAPTSIPTVAPTSEPAGEVTSLPPAPFDVPAQAAALRPEFVGDLARQGEWNRYTISAEADPAAHTLRGQLRLEYTNRDSAALDRLYFHLYPNLPDFGGRLDIQRVAVDGAPGEIVYETRRYLLRVDLPQPLAPSATTAVTLDWATTTPRNAGARLYGAFNSENGLLTLASAYPIVAIVRGGQWDIGWPDPKGDFVNSETALYDVTLRAPTDWSVVSTGVVTVRRDDAGTQRLHIVSGPQRDFTLALAQFQLASADVEGTRINSYFRAANAAGGQAALEAASNALRVFNKRYGPYPLRELDVVEIPANTFLGVEYPGMVMIADSLYDSGNGIELTVAHEVGHQWWFSQVGNDVQTASWLDEALASYSQIVYQEEMRGPAAAEQELNGFRERYQRTLALGRDAPAQQPNSAFTNNYVLLVYGKAVLFFQAMRQQIGDVAFDRFLHNYYAANRYRYVTGADLVRAANQACSCDVQPLYDDWITRAVPLSAP